MSEIIYSKESYKIMGACFNVYRDKGCGFLEAVYQECLQIEFDHQQIPYMAQPELVLSYRGKQLHQTYRPDFICYDKIIVEIKALSKLADEHRAQILNYLNASKFKLGILINFGHYPKIQYQRFAFQKVKNTYAKLPS